MKKIVSLSLFSVISLFTSGQSIVVSTNLWSNIMVLEPTGQMFTEKIKFTNDTTIGLNTYKVVERTLDKNQLSWNDYGFIREDANKRVFYKLNASDPEKLLYDLSLTLGDSVLAFGVNTFNYTAYIDSVMYHVTGVDSMLIGSTYRKQLHLSGDMGGSPVEATQWIDSTGGLTGILHNWNLKVGEDGYSLLCFEENGILKYHNPLYTDCFVATGIESMNSRGVTVSVSPNPVCDNLTISRKNTNSEGNIIIYDGFGKIYFREDHFSGDIIDVSSFPEGIYILGYSDSHSYTLKKFIVFR